jgi:imidazolonepropionase-like amidohydrolase
MRDQMGRRRFCSMWAPVSIAIAGTVSTTIGQAQIPATSRPPVPGAPAGVTAFVGVTVVPMDTERVLPNHTVLIQNGWITALGPSGQVTVPTGAVRIDGRGRYLVPGLADMHAHISYPSPFRWREERQIPHDSDSAEAMAERRLFAWLADGITTIRNLDNAPPHPRTGLKLSGVRVLRLRARAAAGELLSPRIYTSAAWAGRYLGLETVPLDSVATYIAAYKAAGYHFLKLHDEPQELAEAAVAAARSMGLPVLGHVQGGITERAHSSSSMTPEQALAWAAAMGYTSIEHLAGYLLSDWGDEVKRRDSSESLSTRIRALATATRRAGIWNCPTFALNSSAPNAAQLVKALQDAGAGLLLGTDAPLLRGGIHAELEALVKLAGLTPYQALVTGTRNVAQYFGTLDSAGTVTVGKRADLVLLSGNPLQDIRHTREPAGVMVAGRWLDRAALDQGLLAEQKAWFDEELLNGLGAKTRKQFAALVDSLTRATAAAREGVRQRLAAELGALRATLRPKQQELFDMQVRVWLREQARQGYPVAVPGVTPTPYTSTP